MTTHPDGTTTTTTVTRPSPWDEASREAAYTLYDDKADLCAQCGRPISECQSPDPDWFPQLTHCWRTAAATVANRLWVEKHEKTKPDVAGYLPTDGARVWVAPIDLSPGEDFLSPGDDFNPEMLPTTTNNAEG